MDSTDPQTQQHQQQHQHQQQPQSHQVTQQQAAHPHQQHPLAQQAQPPQPNYAHAMQAPYGAYAPQIVAYHPTAQQQYPPTYQYGYYPPPNRQQMWSPQTQNFTPAQPVAAPNQQSSGTPSVPITTRRKRQGLVIKDPITKQPISLEDENKGREEEAAAKTKTTETKQTITQATPVEALTCPTTNTSTSNTTTNINSNSNLSSSNNNNKSIDASSSSSLSASNILLQKVSEEDSDERKSKEDPVDSKKSELKSPVVVNDKSPNEEIPAKEGKLVEATASEEEKKKLEVNSPVDDANEKPKVGEQDKEEEEAETNEAVDDKENSETGNGLHYKPEQYNPITNRTGRRVYDRQFLVDVCEKVMKQVIWNETPPNMFTSERTDPFGNPFGTQGFLQANRQDDSGRLGGRQNYGGRSSAGQERPKKIIPSSSLTQEVQLKTVSNPWKPAANQVKDDVPQDVTDSEDLKKKFRSILNKLTPNNFDNLSKAVTELHIDTEAKLGDVIDIVFAKALAEPGYCVLYGQMCSHLKKITAGTANFGNTLLKRCQYQFQSDIYSGLNVDERKEKIEKEENPDIKKQLDEELYEDMYRCRVRSLGLIKFIGELYKIDMLNDTIMFDCINRLLGDTSEESLECLCDLLTTIGENLDESSKKSAKDEKKPSRPAPRGNAYSSQRTAASVVAAAPAANSQPRAAEPLRTLDSAFEQLHKIRKSKELNISLRIKFKILDVCELREKDNWKSKKTKDNNPKKIEEIREAHKEKLESEKRQNAMGPRRSQEGRRGLGHSSGSSHQISSLAYEGGRGGMHSSSSSHSIRDSLGDNSNSRSENETFCKAKSQVMSSFLNPLSKSSNSNDKSPLKPGGLLQRVQGSAFGGSASGGGLRPNSLIAGKAAASATNDSNNSGSEAKT